MVIYDNKKQGQDFCLVPLTFCCIYITNNIIQILYYSFLKSHALNFAIICMIFAPKPLCVRLFYYIAKICLIKATSSTYFLC